MDIFDEYGSFLGKIVPVGGAFGGILLLFLGLTVFVFWLLYYAVKQSIELLSKGDLKGLLYILAVILFLAFGYFVSAK
jgi:hypothetical protein